MLTTLIVVTISQIYMYINIKLYTLNIYNFYLSITPPIKLKKRRKKKKITFPNRHLVQRIFIFLVNEMEGKWHKSTYLIQQMITHRLLGVAHYRVI